MPPPFKQRQGESLSASATAGKVQDGDDCSVRETGETDVSASKMLDGFRRRRGIFRRHPVRRRLSNRQ
jgi:hypothetical protein